MDNILHTSCPEFFLYYIYIGKPMHHVLHTPCPEFKACDFRWEQLHGFSFKPLKYICNCPYQISGHGVWSTCQDWCQPDFMFSSDSCLSGCGGFWQGNYFHPVFPDFIQNRKFNINVLEMLSIFICLNLWGKCFKGERIQVFCDNESNLSSNFVW